MSERLKSQPPLKSTGVSSLNSLWKRGNLIFNRNKASVMVTTTNPFKHKLLEALLNKCPRMTDSVIGTART